MACYLSFYTFLLSGVGQRYHLACVVEDHPHTPRRSEGMSRADMSPNKRDFV
jgi:hypothetical protein